MCKYFTIICNDPEPICEFITQKLNRSATVYHAEGAYQHNDKAVILSVMKRSQAVELRNFIHENQPSAFIAITNSSEIIGKRFPRVELENQNCEKSPKVCGHREIMLK